MQTLTGDIWSFADRGWIVIPTNAGWKKDGSNVMGAGLAKQAAARDPALPAVYGAKCRLHWQRLPVLPYTSDGIRLLLFPVKPLRVNNPAMSWNQPASLKLVQQSLWDVKTMLPGLVEPRQVYLPLVGCGAGGLSEKKVLPLIEEVLGDCPEVTLVRSPGV